MSPLGWAAAARFLARLQKMKERCAYDRGLRQTPREAAQVHDEALCSQHPLHGRTALGMFNAVCEIADHTRCGRDSGASLIVFRAEPGPVQ